MFRLYNFGLLFPYKNANNPSNYIANVAVQIKDMGFPIDIDERLDVYFN